MRYFNLEVERAKAQQKLENEKLMKQVVQKINEQSAKPMNSWQLIQNIKESEKKKPVLRDVLNPDQAMEQFHKVLHLAGLTLTDEIKDAHSKVLQKDREYIPFHLDNLTDYTAKIIRATVQKLINDAKGRKRVNVNLNPTLEY